jgi:hypothetical protein
MIKNPGDSLSHAAVFFHDIDFLKKILVGSVPHDFELFRAFILHFSQGLLQSGGRVVGGVGGEKQHQHDGVTDYQTILGPDSNGWPTLSSILSKAIF